MCLIGDFNIMKALRIFLNCLASELALIFLCSCATDRSDASKQELSHSNPVIAANEAASNTVSYRKELSGTEQIFTNANVVMWVPVDAERIWDGPTSSVEFKRTSPPHVLPESYKIMVEIQIDSEQEFKRNAELSQDWYFQEHATLSVQNVQVGRQFRKDLRDPQRGRILLIDALVDNSDTFQEDVETATRMIESIKLFPK